MFTLTHSSLRNCERFSQGVYLREHLRAAALEWSRTKDFNDCGNLFSSSHNCYDSVVQRHPFRSSRAEMFYKNGAFKNFANLTGKTCSRVSFFNKGTGILTIFGILTMIIRKSPWKCLHNNWKLYYITATVNILMSNNMITILISLFRLKQILLINMEINSFKNTRLGSKRLNDETR